jgi:hypothetical protein
MNKSASGISIGDEAEIRARNRIDRETRENYGRKTPHHGPDGAGRRLPPSAVTTVGADISQRSCLAACAQVRPLHPGFPAP